MFFKVHSPNTSVKNIRPPVIELSHLAAEHIWHVTDMVNDEVGGLGSVRYIQDGHIFRIEECFLPKQDVHSATTELDPEGVAELMEELLITRENGLELVNSIRFWWHSHVNMGLSPSSQDEDELRKLSKDAGDWFISCRVNKRGEIRFDMLTEQGFLYHDLPWQYPATESPMRAELTTLVSERVKRISTWGKGGAKRQVWDQKKGKMVWPDEQDLRGRQPVTTSGWPAQSGVYYGDEHDQLDDLEGSGPGVNRKHVLYNKEGGVTAVRVRVLAQKTEWVVDILQSDLIEANIEPELMEWAPFEIDLDRGKAAYYDTKGDEVEDYFGKLDEMEIDAIRAVFVTEPGKKVAQHIERKMFRPLLKKKKGVKAS